MPCVASKARPWILEGLELQSLCRQANRAPICEESLSIGRHQVCHGVALPSVTVQPEAAVHGEDHPISSMVELAVHQCDFGPHASSCAPCVAAPSRRRSVPRSLRAQEAQLSQRTQHIGSAMPWGESLAPTIHRGSPPRTLWSPLMSREC